MPDLIGASPMGTRYNRLAGQSVERLAALSDGVFAVAMTLLALDLRVPAAETVHNERELWAVLWNLAPRLVVYLMSFLTLGIFWVGQQTQLNHLERGDRDLAWIHLAFLFGISLMPFATSLMAEFIVYRMALLAYWTNILLLGLILLAAWRYAVRKHLLKQDAPAPTTNWVERRIIIAQALYAFGALLCVFSTYWSIGFIILVQLNYAIAPRIGILARI